MKMAQGYVTDDGTFFESKQEAELHEAESRLRGTAALAFPELNVDMFITVILQLRNELGEYLNAYAAATTNQRDHSEVEDRAAVDDRPPPEIATGTGHVSSAEEDLAALLKLPPRGPSNVSNVGSGPRTEKVQERRSEHGPRVRGANASSVRRRKDMAVKPDTKA